MEKENKKNKITNKSKSLKKSNDSDNSSSSKKSKSLKKSNDSDNSSSSKGFSKIYLLIGLILIIGVGIGLYFLLRDDSNDKDDKDDKGNKDEEENKNDEEKDSSNKNKTSNNNTLIIVLSVIGFVYITGVLFAFYNNKGALSFASWFSLFFGSGKSSVEKRDSEKSEKKGSGKRDSEKLKDSEKAGVKLKKAVVLEGIKKAGGKLKNAGGKLKKATEKKLKERSEKKDTITEIEEALSKRKELAETRV